MRVGQVFPCKPRNLVLGHAQQVEFLFRFAHICQGVLVLGFSPLVFRLTDRASLQQDLGPIKRFLGHPEACPGLAIFQLPLPKLGAVQQEQLVPCLHPVAQIRIHGHDPARHPWAQMGQPVLIGQDFPPLRL